MFQKSNINLMHLFKYYLIMNEHILKLKNISKKQELFFIYLNSLLHSFPIIDIISISEEHSVQIYLIHLIHLI